MPFIAPEVILEAKRMDLLTYLRNYEPHERLSNRVYEYNRDEKEVSIAKETNEKVKAMER